MEFPEDKVKYTINIVQEECVVTIIAKSRLLREY